MSSEIRVDAGKRVGAVRRINGGNGGPICFGGLVDLTERHRRLRIPINRTHDPNWPGGREVDIHTIFPDFGADPGNPSSYLFAPTDDYILSLVDMEQEVMFRLGESIEHTRRKHWARRPPDPEKWAQICVGIVRHYNEGWADGFDLGIRYWEIWNEPDLGPAMWDGTFDEYIDLYAAASRAIKSRFPDVKVGGPASVGIGVPQVEGLLHKPVEAFLDRCKAEGIPLDFLSWHCYMFFPGFQVDFCKAIRRILDEKYGMRGVELHLDEWNYAGDGLEGILSGGGERLERFAKSVGDEAAAAYAACFLIAMQDSPVDMTYFYSLDTGCLGMFSPFGVPKKTYYSFLAFAELAEHPARLEVSGTTRGEVEALAGIDDGGGEISLMIGSYRPPTPPFPAPAEAGLSRASVCVENVPWDGPSEVEVSVVNGGLDLGTVLKEARGKGDVRLDVDLSPPSVTLVTVRRAGGPT